MSNNVTNKESKDRTGTLFEDFKTTERARKAFPYVAAAFCVLLILSNIVAVKPIVFGSFDHFSELGPVQIWPLILDGGCVLFPITYIIDDVLSEIYGFKTARKVIFTGFALEILAIITITIVAQIPSTPDWGNDDAFVAVLGYVPRIVTASLCAYLIGELLNSVILVKLKQRMGEKHLWVRLIGSTLVGEASDTIIFCTIAFFGTLTFSQFLNYTIVGYLFKCGLEVVLLPITYRVIKYLKS